MRGIFRCVFLLLLIQISIACVQVSTPLTLVDAKREFYQFNFGKSRAIYEEVSQSISLPDKDKVEALQTLSYQDWQIFEDYNLAQKRIKRAIAYKINESRSWQILSQIQLEATLFDESLESAYKSLQYSDSKNDTVNARLSIAAAILEKSIAHIEDNQEIDTEKLKECSLFLNKILEEVPGKPIPSSLLLGISLCLEDGKGIQKAWNSFFHVFEGKKVNKVLLESSQTLETILPQWDQNKNTYDSRKRLIIALSKSRLYDYAKLIVLSSAEPIKELLRKDAIVRNTIMYADYIESFKSINRKYYPQIARGLSNYNEQYDKEVELISRELWENLSFSVGKDYNEESFFDILQERFGTYGYSGETVGYYSWLLGHIIYDGKQLINQYDYQTNIRYIKIGELISRDFTSWLGATNVGGWGTDSCFVEVRDAYIYEPYNLWNWVADEEVHSRMHNRCIELYERDVEICKDNPYCDPPGIATRLKFKAVHDIYEELINKGLEGKNLCLAFVSEYNRLKIESSIFAHEGRHSIDQIFFADEFESMSSAEREFRAKLSEVAFSSCPKLALTGSILGSGLGEDTDHGEANRKFRELLVQWMEGHMNEIADLDKTKPLMPQVDLLSNEQIISICKTADPLNKNY